MMNERLMQLIAKALCVALILALVFLASFEAFQDSLSSLFDYRRSVALFEDMRSIGWLPGIPLLIAGILLPVPSTGIMAASGLVYGVCLGGLIASIGSLGAGKTEGLADPENFN